MKNKKNMVKKLGLTFMYNQSLVFLLNSNLTNGLHLHQFLGTKTTEANKSLKTDANGAHLMKKIDNIFFFFIKKWQNASKNDHASMT